MDDDKLRQVATEWGCTPMGGALLFEMRSAIMTADHILQAAWNARQAGRDNGKYRKAHASARTLLDVSGRCFRAWAADKGLPEGTDRQASRSAIRLLLDDHGYGHDVLNRLRL